MHLIKTNFNRVEYHHTQNLRKKEIALLSHLLQRVLSVDVVLIPLHVHASSRPLQ